MRSEFDSALSLDSFCVCVITASAWWGGAGGCGPPGSNTISGGGPGRQPTGEEFIAFVSGAEVVGANTG